MRTGLPAGSSADTLDTVREPAAVQLTHWTPCQEPVPPDHLAPCASTYYSTQFAGEPVGNCLGLLVSHINLNLCTCNSVHNNVYVQMCLGLPKCSLSVFIFTLLHLFGSLRFTLGTNSFFLKVICHLQ